MTTVCSGGSSAAKAGVPSALVVDAQYIQSILPAPLNWLYPYLPYMHGLQIGDVGAFCATDPPTWSVPTAEQIYNFVKGGPLTDYDIVNQFLQDITRAYLWYNACECSSVATPAPPSPPSAPADLPAINPPVLVGPGTASPCASFPFYHIGSWAPDGSTWPMAPFTQGNTPATHPVAIPAGATSMQMTLTCGPDVQAGAFVALYFQWFGTLDLTDPLGGDSMSALAGATSTKTFLVSPGAASVSIWAVGGQSSGHFPTMDMTGQASVYCGGLPGQTQSPCCPPDAVATGLLTSILQAITLIQRQLVPFAYIDGASHSSLTGFGEISVQGLIGLKLTITDSGPGVLGVAAGDPETVWEAGWYRWGNADGWSPRVFITSVDLVDLPPAAGAYTKIGYSLNATVEVTITELEREA